MGPLGIGILLALSLGLALYTFLVPRSTVGYTMGMPGASMGSGMRVMAALSSEIHAALPASVATKLVGAPSTKLELLIQRSGNPWNIKPQDFRILQVTGLAAGLLLGWGVGFGLSFTLISPPIWLLVLAAGSFGFFFPKLKYDGAAKQRDLDFKRQLPDALDLIIISLSSGSTFATSLREALPQMKAGVLKDELKEVSRSIDSGKTLNASLESFSKKAPSESIRAFVRAVQEATELNVPLIEVLESRAEASRKEFFALLQSKTASLESKMMAVLTPTLVPALLIIVIAPSVGSLLGTVAG